jgi:hypothetical protein
VGSRDDDELRMVTQEPAADSPYSTTVPMFAVTIMLRIQTALSNHLEDTKEVPVTPAEFRRIALGLPDVIEASHMAHPDFRVGGKIFATLGCPSARFGVVMLSMQDQYLMVRDYPTIFAAVRGSWGASGATTILLRRAPKRAVELAIEAAWRKRAPKRLTARLNSQAAPGSREDR